MTQVKQQEKKEKLKEMKKVKSWHGCWKTCHDLELKETYIWHWWNQL